MQLMTSENESTVRVKQIINGTELVDLSVFCSFMFLVYKCSITPSPSHVNDLSPLFKA